MISEVEIEQARKNLAKTVRAAVRLRHSIAADNELFEVLPKALKAFDDSVQRGELPDPQRFTELIDG